MPGILRERLIRKLANRVGCGLCGRPYRAGTMRLVAHNERLWIFHVFCQHCRTAGFICLLLDESQPLLRDVSTAEWERFRGQPPVSADDVLDLHQLLNHFAGDLTQLAGGP